MLLCGDVVENNDIVGGHVTGVGVGHDFGGAEVQGGGVGHETCVCVGHEGHVGGGRVGQAVLD